MSGIWMKKPSGWAGELWRESLPVGNGRTSALLCGSVGYEHLWVNRFDRWENGGEEGLPDVSDALARTRGYLEAGEYARANDCLAATLRERGYQTGGYRSSMATPMAPVEIQLRFESNFPFRHYARGIDFETGEAFVRFEQGGERQERRAFASRADDQIVLRVTSTGRMSLKVDKPADGRLCVRISAAGGVCEDRNGYWQLRDVTELTVLAKFDEAPAAEDYGALLARHLPLYREAMGDAELTLCGQSASMEALLDCAAEDRAPVELFDRLWHFGRYLFVSGTCEGGHPFPLYGLWNGTACPPWAQNVANENVQCIYWHAPVGGYARLLRPLIHYYYSKLDAFRDSARKLFGCRGIYVSTYTTPDNSLPAPNVPVIVNYIGCAGWLCRHFYDYYRYTGDEALMREEILPFMLETAAFYEDYVVRGADGKIRIIPSVSPENTPGNFIPEDFQAHMAHPNPVVWNATMDFAIMKELLAHLIGLSEAFALDPERVRVWEGILKDVPDYMVNEDGAIREWMDEGLDDFYRHRHLSHIYPLFPGEEIDRTSPLFPAFERAVDLRELGGLSGWSLVHMAAIYARMGRGEQALDCLDNLARGCLLPNGFTLHNDWRDMGVTLKIDMAPVQLDALMGAVNAVQEMLLRVGKQGVELLPACPESFGAGRVENWRFPGGRISFAWNRAEGAISGELVAEREIDVTVAWPEWAGRIAAHLHVQSDERVAL